MTKISHSSSPESFFQVQNSLKPVFGPHWGSLLRSPRPLSRMGRGISIPLPLKGYGVSDLSQLINYYLVRERKFQGTKVPGSESSWERSLLGAKVLRCESSCYRLGFRVGVSASYRYITQASCSLQLTKMLAARPAAE